MQQQSKQLLSAVRLLSIYGLQSKLSADTNIEYDISQTEYAIGQLRQFLTIFILI